MRKMKSGLNIFWKNFPLFFSKKQQQQQKHRLKNGLSETLSKIQRYLVVWTIFGMLMIFLKNYWDKVC